MLIYLFSHMMCLIVILIVLDFSLWGRILILTLQVALHYLFYAPSIETVGEHIGFGLYVFHPRVRPSYMYGLGTLCMDSSWKNSWS